MADLLKLLGGTDIFGKFGLYAGNLKCNAQTDELVSVPVIMYNLPVYFSIHNARCKYCRDMRGKNFLKS
jgi:hypothetical protein